MLAAVTESGSTLTLTLDANEAFGIVSSGLAYQFASNQTFTDSGVSVTSEFSAFGGGTLTLLASGLAHYATVEIVDGGVSTTVTFNDSGVNAYSDHVTVVLDDATGGTIAFNGSTSLTGANTLDVRTSRNIVVNSGASIATDSGNLTFVANQQTTSASGNFIGINVNNASVRSPTGSVLLQGRGGDTGSFNHGVRIQAGGNVSTTSTGGTVTVEGTGGAGVGGGNNYGVYVTGTGSLVTSGGGNVMVTGVGGGSGDDNYGVNIDRSGRVTSGSNGTVTIHGTGGDSSGGSNEGVVVFSTGIVTSGGSGSVIVQGTAVAGSGSGFGIGVSVAGTVTSGGGNVSVTGFGGGSETSNANIGVTVGGAGTVTAGGTGSVTAQGTGGATTSGHSNYGIYFLQGAGAVTSNGGSVSVTGQGGSGTGGFHFGVYLLDNSTVTAGGSGTVTVDGTGGTTGSKNYGVHVAINSSTITSGGGAVSVTGTGGGTSADNESIGVLLSHSGTISSGGGASITVRGTGGLGIINNDGVRLREGASSQVLATTATPALVRIIGQAGEGANSVGINLITSGNVYSSGNVELIGDTISNTVTGTQVTASLVTFIANVTPLLTGGGIFTVDGSGTFDATAGYTVSPSRFGDFVHLVVTGDNRTITLGGASLVVSMGSPPFAGSGDVFRIIDSTGTGSVVSGIFSYGGTPLNDGDTFTVGGTIFRINYNPVGAAGDVILTEAGNSPPIVDLDGADGGLDFTAAFVEGAGAVNIADTDAIISDAQQSVLSGLVLVVSANPDGADESLTVAGLAVPLNADASGTGSVGGTTFQVDYVAATLTLTISTSSGSGATGDYQSLMRGITYNNSSTALNGTTRTVTVTASDGIANSLLATSSITIAAVDLVDYVVGTLEDEDDGQTVQDADLSLREAIRLANANASFSTITFAPGLFSGGGVVALAFGQMTISESVKMIGASADATIIDAQGLSRIFDITGSASVTLENMTLIRGTTTGPGEGGGAIRSVSSGMLTIVRSTLSGNSTTGEFSEGGAVAVFGSMAVTDSTLSGNFTAGQYSGGGAIYSANGNLTITSSTLAGNSTTGYSSQGGAIFVLEGDVTVTGSTLSGNQTIGESSYGGAISSPRDGNVAIVNSTLSGNNVNGTGSFGGGALYFDDGDVTITNSTITGNFANIGGGIGIFDDDFGESLTIHNSIIADNTAAMNPDFTAPGNSETNLVVLNSLIGDNAGTGLTETVGTTPDSDGNFIGSAAVAGIIDPLLGALQDNGGPTFTHTLLAGSLALNSGDDALALDITGSPLTTDQRGAGFARITGGRVDMGAHEAAPPTLANPGNIQYAIGDPAAAIDSGITVTDTDSASLLSATVTITNFVPGEDELSFVNDGSSMGDIAISTNVAGLLTLSSVGSATLGEWQAALRAVTYANNSSSPNMSQRSVDFVVNDGTAPSNTLNSTMNITLRVPVITGPTAVTPFQRPTIAWTAVPGAAKYEVWIGNQSTGVNPFLHTVRTATAFYPSSDLGIGQYNLWVRAISGTGENSRFTPQYNFRINTAAILNRLHPVQTTPTPTLEWRTLAGAVEYDLWIDNVSTGQSQVVRGQNLAGTSFTTPVLDMGLYRAWVRGVDASGRVASWSASISFDVVLPVNVPAAPTSTFDLTPTLTWNPVPGAVGYDLVLRNANTGAIVYNPINISGNSYTPPTDLTTGIYRWYVLAVGPSGFRSQSATTQEFFAGGRSTLLTPSGTNSDSTPEFTWSEVDGAVTYDLFVTRTDVLTGGIINMSGLTGTSYIPVIPLPIGTYRAWIRAVSATAQLSPWSIQVNFSTSAAIGEPDFTPENLPLTEMALLDGLFARVGANPSLSTTTKAAAARDGFEWFAEIATESHTATAQTRPLPAQEQRLAL